MGTIHITLKTNMRNPATLLGPLVNAWLTQVFHIFQRAGGQLTPCCPRPRVTWSRVIPEHSVWEINFAGTVGALGSIQGY